MNYEMEGWNLSMRTALLPKDTNQHGTIFGGVLLSLIDMAGAIEAKRLCQQEVVTVALREVVFKEPVFVGDLVSLYTRIIATGRTSITTEVTVISFREGACCMVTTAQVTYVSIDANRKAIPIEIRRSQIDPPAFSQEYLQDKLEMATPAAPQAGT